MGVVKIILKPLMLIRRLYWRLIKPTTIGVRAIILNNNNEILLVKHAYSNEWYLPGGKANKKEPLIDAIKRELREEVGIISIESISPFHTYLNLYEYKRDYITVFIVHNYVIKRKAHFEIEKIGFFSSNDIPVNTSRGTKRRLREFFHNQNPENIW